MKHTRLIFFAVVIVGAAVSAVYFSAKREAARDIPVADRTEMAKESFGSETDCTVQYENTTIALESNDEPFVENPNPATAPANRRYFRWSLSPELYYQCENSITWYLVRSVKPDPVHNGKNYWYRTVSKYNFNVIDDLPSGTHHFRVCMNVADVCVKYSNDAVVQIP